MMLLALLLAISPPGPARSPEHDAVVEIEAPPAPVEAAPTMVEPTLPLEPGSLIALPPPPPPPDGAGRLVGGSLTIALGVGAFAAIAVETNRTRSLPGEANPSYVAATFVPLGLASLGVGTYLLVRGGKSRANFRHWEQWTGYDAPGAGNGLIVGGTMLAAVSAVVLVAGTLRSARAEQGHLTTTLVTLGGVGLALGASGLAIGLVRRDRHRRWQRSGAFVLAPPLPLPTRAGVQVVLTARF